MRIALIEEAKVFSGLAFTVLLLATPGCLVRKVAHVHPPGQTVPSREASLAELVNKINAWSNAFQTMTAKVDLEPTAGSVYSEEIKQYHDVTGYILVQKPSTIRMQGLHAAYSGGRSLGTDSGSRARGPAKIQVAFPTLLLTFTYNQLRVACRLAVKTPC